MRPAVWRPPCGKMPAAGLLREERMQRKGKRREGSGAGGDERVQRVVRMGAASLPAKFGRSRNRSLVARSCRRVAWPSPGMSVLSLPLTVPSWKRHLARLLRGAWSIGPDCAPSGRGPLGTAGLRGNSGFKKGRGRRRKAPAGAARTAPRASRVRTRLRTRGPGVGSHSDARRGGNRVGDI